MISQLMVIGCYVFIAVLLLVAIKYSSLSRLLKSVIVIITAVFYLISWLAIERLLGWATPATLPEAFRVHWIHIQEPNKVREEPGSLYYWISSIDDANLQITPPRAYYRPWTVEDAEAAQAAKQRLEAGEILNGRISYNVLGSDARETDKETRTQGQAAEAAEERRPSFEFLTVAPASLPEKINPIQ